MNAIANLVSRLSSISIGHTSVVCDVVVTRWSKGFEIGTFGRATVLLSAEQAAEQLAP